MDGRNAENYVPPLNFEKAGDNGPRRKKTCLGIFDQVRHKLGCTTTKDSQRHEISELGSRGIVLSV